MKQLLGPIRVRLAIAGFVAIYAPVVLITTVFSVTEDEVFDLTTEGGTRSSEASTAWEPVTITALILLPVAALLSWWWSGRAVRPVTEAIAIQEQLMEETSHELRTPLSILSTNAEVLLSHPEPTLEVYRQGLERSGNAAQRMSATIDSLLVDARGRARTLDRRPTDVALLVRTVADELAPLAATRHLTIERPEAGRVSGRVDRDSVERAVTNLLTNAIDHSPNGSTVRTRVRAVGDLIEITVSDEGAGIAPEDRDKIFDRYWRNDPERGVGGGTGIGLAIVRHVATAHGGSITVSSPISDRGGSDFVLTLKA